MCFSKKLIIIIIIIFLFIIFLNNKKEHKKGAITLPIIPQEITISSTNLLNDGNACNFDSECKSNKCKNKYCK